MEKVILSFFEKHNLTLEDKTFVVAVSGGVDSMALVGAVMLLRDEYKLNIHIAHVNHQVRVQSKIEEKYLFNYSLENDIGFHVLHFENQEGVNFQNYAREKRYEFFLDVVAEVGADYLLLAHHAIDNMETIIMRMLRGSSLKGYAGIIEMIEMESFKILRPFLNVLKDDLISFVENEKIKYYEDITNDEDIYTRNRIRKDLIPIIFKEEESAHHKFNEFSRITYEASIVIDDFVMKKIASFSNSDNEVSFQVNEFLENREFVQEEILFRLLNEYKLSRQNILEIIKLIKSEKQNILVEFKDSFTFVKEYDKITILYYLTDPLNLDVVINEVGNYLINDTIEINVAKLSSNNVPSNDELWYNSNMLPIRIRSRKAGDRILLEGGYKKVKDLLIDYKVGILKRNNILIMEKDNEILAVIGIRKSVKLKQIENNDILIKVRSEYYG